MPHSSAVHDLFVDELRDAYDFEKQLVKTLRQMSRMSASTELEEAFSSHLEETSNHVAILEEIFESIELKPRGKHCAGMAGIIEEGKDALEDKEDPAILDVTLVAGARRAEHYEMATYMILVDLANELGYDDAAERFREILEEEMACDQKLAELGRMMLPLAEADDEEEEEDEEDAEEDQPARTASNNTSAKRPSKKSTRA